MRISPREPETEDTRKTRNERQSEVLEKEAKIEIRTSLEGINLESKKRLIYIVKEE